MRKILSFTKIVVAFPILQSYYLVLLYSLLWANFIWLLFISLLYLFSQIHKWCIYKRYLMMVILTYEFSSTWIFWISCYVLHKKFPNFRNFTSIMPMNGVLLTFLYKLHYSSINFNILKVLLLHIDLLFKWNTLHVFILGQYT